MTLAFNSKHPYVPNPNLDHTASRWIASLSDGTTVFEDVTPHERSAWRRLREYVALHNLKVTNLRVEAYGNNRIVLLPYKDIDNKPQINGYWYSKFNSALLTSAGLYQSIGCGIGMVKAHQVYITWLAMDGTIQQEIRAYTPGDEAAIINDQVC